MLRVVIFFGVLFALLPVLPAAGTEDKCQGDFSVRLECWTNRDDPVTLTLDRALSLDGNEKSRAKILDSIEGHTDKLVVQVPAGVSTGEGGTVLLVLADQERRLVDPDAKIDRLKPSTREALKEFCTAPRKALCDLVAQKEQKEESDPVSGTLLIGKRLVTEHPAYLAGSPDDSGDGGPDHRLLTATATVLALLLAALFLLVRRTRTAPAPASGPAPAARTADEPTRALRTTPARPGRHRAPSGPTRPAIVRTDLHPQGYVELDRVLYRALWADPGQAPPSPGSRVDVTDAPEPDSDVLHAFPPAAGRHAHAR
ncbi:hypothetical protein ACFWWC_07700 [Streptomyces sp. NPDC058642]|uniref:hypothetical protein n=1 Tax=Streptomyces sp. NPDC058642 TaxID=3346572 RepID=UPI00365857A2